MKEDRRLLLAIAGLALAMLAFIGGTAALVWATLDGPERESVSGVLGPRAALVFMVALVVFAAAATLLRKLFLEYVAAPARLLEQTQVLLATEVQRELPPQGSAANRALTEAINQLAAQRGQLRTEVAQQVAQASRGIEQERSRLAALMAELTQSVVVCNLDGRILLYNQRAKLQFRALAPSPIGAGGAELIGLGRSIYTVFERKLVAHALESIQQRLRRGDASPSAQFVTATPGGQLLRAQMAPVREVADGPGDADPALSGFVLLLDDITAELEAQTARDHLLHGLTEGSRASLGNLQAAVEMLDYPDLEPAMRERFHAVIRDEVGAMSRRIRALADDTAQGMKARWPLEDMLGADLVAAALQRIESLTGARAAALDVNAALWLEVDSFSLLQALAYLAGRLADEYGIKLVHLRLQPAGDGSAQPQAHTQAHTQANAQAQSPTPTRAHLDLLWTGQAMSTETVVGWETEPMKIGAEATAMTLRDVVQRHGGEFWFERERVRHQAFFRFLLPLAGAQASLPAANFVRGDSRPEFYDFDLFQTSAQNRELDERALSELSYTVFDTETTGLDPSAGDEIIQIGATRIVNGKLLRSECFEQLIDPQRSMAAASIAIHGIQPQMLAGQPRIAAVLPAFHAFAADTVLVAHNAAFDMRFLQMKEAATGVRFEQPVLDTLLLSAVLHPNQESHRLEAIAERLGVPVLGRHTAMGDAIVTAEVFLRLVPLLQAKGIHTLGQAREAAKATYLARVSY